MQNKIKPIKMDIDYAEKYGIKDIQNKLKIIISKVDHICRSNNINYSIAYGTQIGAVRHGGFIPWDDDIDIVMLREDFNKFKCILESNNSSSIKLIYNLWIERVISCDDEDIFIDIMILDNYPSNKFLALVKGYLCRAFQGTMKESLDWQKYSTFNKVLLKTTGVLGRILGKNICLSLYTKVQQISNSRPSKHVASFNSGYRDVFEPFERNWFNEYIDIEFDELTLRSNLYYHEFLEFYYGDYMQLPPEEKRVPEHGRISL